MDLSRVRIGFAAGHHHAASAEERAAELFRRAVGCDTLYLYPNASSSVDTSSNVNIKWDTNCQVGADKIDIWVYQPSAPDNPLVQKFTGIAFSQGEYTAKLSPTWVGNETTTQIYLNFVKSGVASYLADLGTGQGPLFNVTYTPTVVTVSGQAYTQPPANTGKTTFQSVEETQGKKSNKGVIAVAVVIPIVVVCILAAVAFYFYRIKEKKKLQRWSQALSQHSQLEWEKGALPGERISSSYGRPSSAYSAYSRSGGRPSTGYGRPSTGYGRPSMSSVGRPTSSVMLDNMAGAGAGLRAFPGAADMDPNRSSIVMPDGHVRQSRISFADTARPRLSSDNRPRVASGLSAHNASVDELRNLEAVAFVTHPGDDSVEALSPEEHLDYDHHLSPNSAASPQSPGGAGSPTVQYGPDQMLAVYAQRKGSTSPTPPAPAVTAVGSKVKRFLTRKEKKTPIPTPQEVRVTAPSPEPTTMRSYVHLNNGTAPAHAVDNLPAPGPPRPDSAQSAVSRYEDAREHV